MTLSSVALEDAEHTLRATSGSKRATASDPNSSFVRGGGDARQGGWAPVQCASPVHDR